MSKEFVAVVTEVFYRGYRIDPSRGIIYGKKGKPFRERNKKGYMRVSDNSGYIDMAHRMIWECVNGPIPPGFDINHINGIRDDNRIENLEVVTRRANLIHAHQTGLATGNVGEKNPMSKLTAEKVKEIRQSNELISAAAKRHGVSEFTIWSVRSRRSWKHLP